MSKILQAAVLGYVLLSVLVLAAAPMPTKAQTSDSNSNLIFQDDFNGSSLDLNKWSVVQNINGGHGGTFDVANSYLSMSSSGTSFSKIESVSNPFQNTTSWTLEFDVTYTFLGYLGSGVIISAGSHFPYNGSQRAILQIWDYQFSSVDFYFLPNERVLSPDKDYVVDRVSFQQTLLVKLVSDNGAYSLYVNNRLIASEKSNLQPDRIIIGHPEAAIIPFDSDAPWCSFKMDSIGLYDNSSSPAPSPLPSLFPSSTPTSTETAPPTTENETAVDFEINGNITRSQMSNITITSNKTTDTTEISFTVTGENGTVGFCNMTIPKSTLPDGLAPAIYIDGALAADQGYTQDSSNYYVWFTTHFSTHQITINFAKASRNPEQSGLVTIYGVIVAAAIIATATALLFTVTRRNRNKESLT